MSSYRRSDLPAGDATEGSCLARVIKNAAVGAGVGVAAAIVALTFKSPAASPKMNAGKLFSQLCLELLPMMTGGAALYTGVSCVVENGRGKADAVNSFAGGALTGALILGARRGTLVSAALGAGIFGAAAAAPDLANITGPLGSEAHAPHSVAVGATTPEVATHADYTSSVQTGRNYDAQLR